MLVYISVFEQLVKWVKNGGISILKIKEKEGKKQNKYSKA